MSKTTNRKGKRKMWIVMLIIAIVIVGGILGGILADASRRNEIRALSIMPVDFKSLQDGTYVGKYTGAKSHMSDTKVEVTISEGEISDIKVLKGALDKEGNPVKLTGGRSIDDLFNQVIEAETLQVDVISGATLTSKTHLKALENALKQADLK